MNETAFNTFGVGAPPALNTVTIAGRRYLIDDIVKNVDPIYEHPLLRVGQIVEVTLRNRGTRHVCLVSRVSNSETALVQLDGGWFSSARCRDTAQIEFQKLTNCGDHRCKVLANSFEEFVKIAAAIKTQH